MKMEENERGNLTRLMKVKDMIVEQEIEKRRQQSEARRQSRT
jgi:V/A-type H+-transporting ATPase subunit D